MILPFNGIGWEEQIGNNKQEKENKKYHKKEMPL